MDLKDYQLPKIKKGVSDYFRKSDRIWCEFKKTFKDLKKAPRFSFLMRLVKIHGEDEVVKKLGNLRELKTIDKIADITKYMQGMF